MCACEQGVTCRRCREDEARCEDERYVVTSVSGFSGDGGFNSHYRTKWQVLDRPYCYELVAETPSEQRARTIAADLESGGRTHLNDWRMRRGLPRVPQLYEDAQDA